MKIHWKALLKHLHFNLNQFRGYFDESKVINGIAIQTKHVSGSEKAKNIWTVKCNRCTIWNTWHPENLYDPHSFSFAVQTRKQSTRDLTEIVRNSWKMVPLITICWHLWWTEMSPNVVLRRCEGLPLICEITLVSTLTKVNKCRTLLSAPGRVNVVCKIFTIWENYLGEKAKLILVVLVS